MRTVAVLPEKMCRGSRVSISGCLAKLYVDSARSAKAKPSLLHVERLHLTWIQLGPHHPNRPHHLGSHALALPLKQQQLQMVWGPAWARALSEHKMEFSKEKILLSL